MLSGLPTSVDRSEKTLKHPKLKGSFPCESCPMVFTNSTTLKRHRQTLHYSIIFCNWCGCYPNENIQKHFQNFHRLKNVFTCSCCNWTFPLRADLSVHLISKKNENPDSSTPIALPKPTLTPRSLSPSSSSSSTTSNEVSREGSPVPPQMEIDVSSSQNASTEELKEFKQMFDNEIDRLIGGGLYSYEDLSQPETWQKMIETALITIAISLQNQNQPEKTSECSTRRPAKRQRTQ